MSTPAVPPSPRARPGASVHRLTPLTRSPTRAGAVVLAELVARGGRVAWGVLDPVRPDAECDAAERVRAGIGAITAAGGDLETLVARSLMTPSCGTGRLAPRRERLVGSVLDAAAGAVAATWRSWPLMRPGKAVVRLTPRAPADPNAPQGSTPAP